MQNRNKGLKISNFRLWFLVFSFQLLAILGLCGCSDTFLGYSKDFFTPEKPPYNEQIFASYYQTKLKTSEAADVLIMIHLPEYELLSQSKSVLASSGQKKKGYKRWFNMVAFDENELTAQRKYLLVVDERPKVLLVEPWASLMFDCEIVLASEVLDEPYADESAKRIAILKQVLENFREDIDELGPDNKALVVSGMLVNQALETVLVKLNSSPAVARRLSEPTGLAFEHTSFDKGRIGMLIEGDIVTVKIRLGSIVKKFKVSFEEEEQKY